MSTDIGRYMRLTSAIDAAVDAVPHDHAATAVTGLVGAYNTLRGEARSAIDDALIAEFDRLFPAMATPTAPRAMGGFDPFASANTANEARMRLKTMGGWLSGFVRAAKDEGAT